MMNGETINCPECGEPEFDVSFQLDEPNDRLVAGGRYIRGDNMYPPMVELQFHCTSCGVHEYADMTKSDFLWGIVEFFYHYVVEMKDE